MVQEAWAVGDAYEAYVGRWSRRVAVTFLHWLDVPARQLWLDVGCGTGALTATVLAEADPAEVDGVDPSEGFLADARARIGDARATFRAGDAQSLPLADPHFAVAVPVSAAPGCAVEGPERGASGWLVGFDDMFARVAGRFGRVEPRRAARDLLWGLLSAVERKNSWTLAEQAGHERPDAMQRLLRTACWDAGEVRDDLRAYVVEHLGHPDGVLIPDETGDLKKGSDSVGVQRQYTGTAGRIENAQVAVYLTYASPRGRALIDRRLYLPRCWTEDRTRCQRAGVPDEVIFATKPELAADMVVDALDAGVTAPWVAADEVYGANPGFRAALESRGVGYVLAVACDQRVRTDASTERADSLAARLPKRSWQRYSAGAGSKGPRLYDWAWIALSGDAGEHRSPLVRRGSGGELARLIFNEMRLPY